MRPLGKPFIWLIVFEFCALGALGLTGWHLLAARTSAHAPAAVAPAPHPPEAPPSPAETPASIGLPPGTSARRPGPTPGLDTSPAFVSGQVRQINREQSEWERAEWGILQAGMGFARAYVEAVVLPAVRAAQRGG